MANYIYTRVSTDGQTTDNQTTSLRNRYPDAQIVTETASGAKSRPKLEALVAQLQSGDTLIVAALDRLGRRTTEVLSLIEDLDHRGIILVSQREGIDYSTPTGRLVTQILVSVAEMERALIAERTKAALAAKREQGVFGGRPKVLTDDLCKNITELDAQGVSARRIAKKLGVSNGTVSSYLRKRA